MRNPEQHELAGAFADMLAEATAEGGRRRAAGTKRHWKVDPNHLAAAGRHWTKYQAGERYDDEGIHHLVKVAWRCLAWAYPEMVEDGLIPEDPK